MDSFSIGKIGDFITLQRGFDITQKMQKRGTYPVISSSGTNSYHNEFMVKGPGVVIGRKGSLGTAFYADSDYWPHDTTLWVKDFKGNDPKFIYYYLKALPLKRLDSGSANPTLNRNFVHLLDAALPKPPQQTKISSVLSAIDAKIELNNRINNELERATKTLYDYWFVQFDFPDSEGKPYKSTGGEMIYNSVLKRELPEGWEDTTLWNIASYYNGLAMQKYRPNGEDFLPVIKIKEMNEGVSDKTEKAKLDIPQDAIIDDGDILFSWSASLDIKIWSQGKGALNQHIFKVTSDRYPKSYYYFELVNYLQHFKMMAELRKTTMGHITQDHLKQACIILPPIDLLEKIDKIIEPLFMKQLLLEKEKITLARLRDLLLPMLMNGQVKVK